MPRRPPSPSPRPSGGPDPRQAAQTLAELGLTELEAKLYVQLVRSGPLTGYRIAQVTGKPVANTYKALESLQAKGAVLADDGRPRAYLAVPPEELLARLESEFKDRRKRAGLGLAGLSRVQPDDRVYRLATGEQVVQRARDMLGRARAVAMVDAFPAVLDRIRPQLESAAGRGVAVVLHVYAPTALRRAMIVPEQRPAEIMAKLPGQHLSVVIDAAEYLVGVLARESAGGAGSGRVHQAVWTSSPILAAQQHIGMLYEFMLAAVENALNAGEPTAAQLRRVLSPFRKLYLENLPGAPLLEKAVAKRKRASGAGGRRRKVGGRGRS